MKIAIIGWGSLIWKPERLENHYIGDWQTGGPCLPVEFSRVSQDGRRLTLVIDEANGEYVPTRFVTSKRCNLQDVITDLRKREGTGCKNIGCVYTHPTTNHDNGFPQSEVIRKWATCNKFDAAVWTALESNFKKQKQKEFSVDEATKHLQKLLKDAEDATARKYIENAPPEVCTPLRRHLYIIGWLK